GDHGVDVGMVTAEPRAHDLGIGETGELVEVLLRRKGLPVLGEETDEDLAEDRLVVRERAVEVEDQGACRHALDRKPRCRVRRDRAAAPAAGFGRLRRNSGRACGRLQGSSAWWNPR